MHFPSILAITQLNRELFCASWTLIISFQKKRKKIGYKRYGIALVELDNALHICSFWFRSEFFTTRINVEAIPSQQVLYIVLFFSFIGPNGFLCVSSCTNQLYSSSSYTKHLTPLNSRHQQIRLVMGQFRGQQYVRGVEYLKALSQ